MVVVGQWVVGVETLLFLPVPCLSMSLIPPEWKEQGMTFKCQSLSSKQCVCVCILCACACSWQLAACSRTTPTFSPHLPATCLPVSVSLPHYYYLPQAGWGGHGWSVVSCLSLPPSDSPSLAGVSPVRWFCSTYHTILLPAVNGSDPLLPPPPPHPHHLLCYLFLYHTHTFPSAWVYSLQACMLRQQADGLDDDLTPGLCGMPLRTHLAPLPRCARARRTTAQQHCAALYPLS